MQRRTVLFLSLAAGVAAAASWLWSSWPDEAPPVGPGQSAPAPVAPTPVAPIPTAKGQDPQPAPAGAPRVRVEVIERERYVLPPPVRVQAVQAVDGASLPTVLLAGAGAGFDASPNAAGVALVAITHEGGTVLRQAAVAAGGVARVALGARLVVRGRVADTDDKVVAGSSVWFGEIDHEGNRREFAPDETGSFEAEVLASAGVPFVVRAPGRATQWRVVTVAAPTAPCNAALERGCVLEVQVAAMAVAMAPARLFVVPRSPVGSSLAQWPFFAQVLGDGYAIDANGRALVDDLPAAGEVGVLVRHPRAPLGASQAVVLKGERVRATVPLQFAAKAVQGTVVDDEGNGLAGVAAILRAGSGELAPGASQRLLPPHLDQRGAFWALTDAAGAFDVGVPESTGAVLSLRLAGHAGRDLPFADARPGTPLVLPVWRGGEVELQLSPPRAGVAWVVEVDLAGGLRDVVAADQPYRVSLPRAGRFDFVLTTFVGNEERARERHDDVHATGAVSLQSPRLP